jgi:hypothetical protein
LEGTLVCEEVCPTIVLCNEAEAFLCEELLQRTGQHVWLACD